MVVGHRGWTKNNIPLLLLFLLFFINIIHIGLLKSTNAQSSTSSLLSDVGNRDEYYSITTMQKLFNSSSTFKLIFPLSMKNTSNINATCLQDDPCRSFGELFQGMKRILDVTMKNMTGNNTVNILFIVNVESNIILDEYGDFDLPSSSLISYYLMFQSSERRSLNYVGDYSYWQLEERRDIAWIIFNNLEIINVKISTYVASISFGYANCILKYTQLENFDTSGIISSAYFVVESTELINTNILSTAAYQIYFKNCKFLGTCFIESRSCNQINFFDISMEEASLTLPIYEANQVLFQNGNFTKGYFVVATINVKEIYIQNLHVLECTKPTIVFSLFYSQRIEIINSSIKKSGGPLLIRSSLRVVLLNVDFDRNSLTTKVSDILTSPIAFDMVDQLFMVNVTIQNHYSTHRNAFALEILQNTVIDMTGCNFLNNSMGAMAVHNQLIAESNRYSYSIYNTNFIDNACKTSGCALNLDMIYNLGIGNCKFENNYSPYNGSAIYGTRIFAFTISNNTFQNNKADIFGGAIYLMGTSTENIPGFIKECIFNRNSAIKKGGALYLEYFPLGISKSIFIENQADYGGAIYSFFALPKAALVQSCNFSNNQAFQFGSNLLTYALTFSFEKNEFKIVKPGESIIVNMTAYTPDSEPVPLNSMPNFVKQNYFGKNIYLHVVQQVSSLIFTPYIVGQSEIDNQNIITLKFINSSLLNINVIKCSSEEQLKPFALDSVANIYACEKIPVLSITLLIAILIPSLVIVFGLGIIASICVMKGIIHIQKRLSLLRRKESAERSVEKRIIDKKIIFGDSYEPLLDEEERSNENGQELNMRSFIIPTSEITIEKKIAEGGMGVVYLGLWNNSRVAIKSLKSDQSEDFEREVGLLASLRHPCILTLYGISITDENKYMITEYLEGGSLEKLIYSCKLRELTLSFTDKINILKDIVHGMSYLHTLNPPIIHRDLKPANVLLDKYNRCKIADFGLSLALSQTNNTMTKNIGTFLYMAPETIRSETVGNHSAEKSQRAPKVDVYSFAIIMWELFFEVSPYCKSDKVNNQSDKSIVDVISEVLKGERPNIPFETENQLQEWLLLYPLHENQSNEQLIKRVLKYCELVRQCWRTNPMERPSFSQIIQVLNEISN